MGNKLVKLGQGRMKISGGIKPLVLTFPYRADSIKASVTILIKTDGTVELGGMVGDLRVARVIMEAGRERLERYHQAQQGGVELFGPDGQRLVMSAGPDPEVMQ